QACEYASAQYERARVAEAGERVAKECDEQGIARAKRPPDAARERDLCEELGIAFRAGERLELVEECGHASMVVCVLQCFDASTGERDATLPIARRSEL